MLDQGSLTRSLPGELRKIGRINASLRQDNMSLRNKIHSDNYTLYNLGYSSGWQLILFSSSIFYGMMLGHGVTEACGYGAVMLVLWNPYRGIWKKAFGA